MRTIAVNKHTRNLLDDYADGNESMNKTINRLLDNSVIIEQQDRTKTNINISDATLNKLKEFKAYPTESHSDTILRLLESIG